MAATIEGKIVEGLLTWFQGVTLPTGTKVAYPNVDFVPDGNAYVRLSVRKNTPQNTHLGGGMEPIRMGFLLAAVCWPVGQGIIAASDLANAIRDRFAFGTIITHDDISIFVTAEPAVNDDDQGAVYTEIPVVIPWSVYP
jgi:hypothetical protein